MYHAPVPVHVTTLACAEVGAVEQGAVRGSQRIRGQRLCGRPIRVLHQGLQRARRGHGIPQERCRVRRTPRGRCTPPCRWAARLWRSAKQQCVYRHSPIDGNELRKLLADYFTYYNNHGPHQQLDGLTPAHLYFGLPDTRSRTLVPNLIHPQFTLTTA